MTIQTVNLGTAPSGAGGDTFRSTGAKINENFANWNHAASRYVGVNAGNVMEVGAFGVGLNYVHGNPDGISTLNGDRATSGEFCHWGGVPQVGYGSGFIVKQNGDSYAVASRMIFSLIGPRVYYVRSVNDHQIYQFLTSANTVIDSNGFVKSASPIIQLFADKIEANDEAAEQEPLFEKVDVGHYLVKNTQGFSDDGWYIEMPKDANGNVLVTVQYQQLEDNAIEVKTFAKKFDEETGDIIPNLAKPRDIPGGRWIDIRLKELPKPEIKISHTPDDFQPTNLAQAVAEALKDASEQ